MKRFELRSMGASSGTFPFTIPVGEAFALVDSVRQEPDGSLVTAWRVPKVAPYLRGEGDGPWILPGTVMTEMAVQAGELLIAAHRGPTTANEGVSVLTRVKRAAFRRMVTPGETLECRVVLDGEAGPAYFVRGELTCAGDRVGELQLAFAATLAVEALGV